MNTTNKLLLSIALLLSIIPVLGLAKISGSSEAREAHVARVILQTGEWILPDRNGFVPSKPILHHWLIASSSLITGNVSEFTSRLPSALLGIVLIVLLATYVQSVFTKLGQQENKLPLFAVLILVSSYGFFRMIFSSMVDLTFAFFSCIAILTITLALIKNPEADKVSAREWNKFFLFSGLATLAKGPLGLLLPCLFAGVFYISLSGFRKALTDCLRPKVAWLVWICLAVPWYFLAYLKSQAAFVERQLLFENIERFFGGQNISSEPFWFYIPSFLTRMSPWSILLLLLLAVLPWVKLHKQNLQFKVIKSFGLALLSALFFFSIASGKRHSYLLPLFPLVAILLVLLIDFVRKAELVDKLPHRLIDKIRKFNFENFSFSFIKNITLIFLGLYAASMFFLSLSPAKSAEQAIMTDFLLRNSFILLLAPLLAIIFFIFNRNHKDISRYYISVIFLFSATFATMLACITGVKGAYRDYAGMSQQILQQAGQRQIFAIRDKFDELLDPIFFYLGKPVTVVPANKIASHCNSNSAFLIKELDYQALPAKSVYSQELVVKELAGSPKSIQQRQISLFSCKAQS